MLKIVQSLEIIILLVADKLLYSWSLKDSIYNIFSYILYKIAVIGYWAFGNPKIATNYFWLTTIYLLL